MRARNYHRFLNLYSDVSLANKFSTPNFYINVMAVLIFPHDVFRHRLLVLEVRRIDYTGISLLTRYLTSGVLQR
jgi:hypothetical protein